jgi:hypothetical protein
MHVYAAIQSHSQGRFLVLYQQSPSGTWEVGEGPLTVPLCNKEAEAEKFWQLSQDTTSIGP